MELGAALLAVGAGERAASFEIFSDTLDPAWIAQALETTGTATIRRRKLPAERAVWLVIGMGLLRDRSIEEVVRHLNLVLPAHGERQDRHQRGHCPGARPARPAAARRAVCPDRGRVGARLGRRVSLARAGGLRGRRHDVACARHRRE